jgi:predicted ABC-type ATPase
MEAHPAVIMVAGPNGAGKSTIAPGLLAKALGVVEYVNADVIARGLSGFDPDRAALSAGRVMLQRLDELESEKASFAFETTGASRTFVERIARLRNKGYFFLLAYVWVDSADVSVARVERRVLLGGHSVPVDTIRRRYIRGLQNFFSLYRPLADEWRFYNNSQGGNAILIAQGGSGRADQVYGARHGIGFNEWRPSRESSQSCCDLSRGG